jgi:antitoxin ParD1/3/4
MFGLVNIKKSLSKPNDEWLKAILDSEEYQSESEIINDLVRHTRNNQYQIDFIRTKLALAEKSGFTSETKDQISKQSNMLFNAKL